MPMSAEEKFEHWLKVAQYDLDTAEVILKGRRWLYVTFMCQQAVEKLVKGLYTLYVDDDVPRTHNILVLVRHFNDKLPEATPDNYMAFFDRLSTYYLNNRYPDYKKELSMQTGESEAIQVLALTKEAFAWLLTMKP
jgi:HEPN domain-containing protein